MNKNQEIKVFLSDVSNEMEHLRKFLKNILIRAGMKIFTADDFDRNTDIKKNTLHCLNEADCTIHILGNNYGYDSSHKTTTSISEFQFNAAKKSFLTKSSSFKMFVWHPETLLNETLDFDQEKFINSVRNNLGSNMVFSNHDSPVVFVEDIRTIMFSDKPESFETKDTGLFFIYNDLDEDYATGIIDLLSDITKIVKLSIIQNASADYTKYIIEQMIKSNMAVVYFNKTSDWAIPFVQQIWNKTGGASSDTEILLIGDANYEDNQQKKISIPKVTSMILPEELIPLEIKVNLDKISC